MMDIMHLLANEADLNLPRNGKKNNQILLNIFPIKIRLFKYFQERVQVPAASNVLIAAVTQQGDRSLIMFLYPGSLRSAEGL